MKQAVLSRVIWSTVICLAGYSPMYGIQGLHVFHIGNSLTDQAYAMHNIAIGKGYTDVQYGRQMIPGAPISWLWNNQNGGQALSPPESPWNNYAGNTSDYLASTHFDALVMQLFPQNGDNASTMTQYGGNFAEAAYRGNPDCQVYVFGSYPSSGADYAFTLPSYNTMAVEAAQGISARFPDRKPALVVPVMQAFQMVGSAGLYEDGVHANNNGRYLQSLVHFATLYKEDPHGAVTSGLYFWSGAYSIDASFAASAQDAAWNAFQAHPLSGAGISFSVRQKAAGALLPAVTPVGAATALLNVQGRCVKSLSGNRPGVTCILFTPAGELCLPMVYPLCR